MKNLSGNADYLGLMGVHYDSTAVEKPEKEMLDEKQIKKHQSEIAMELLSALEKTKNIYESKPKKEYSDLIVHIQQACNTLKKIS